MDGEIEFWAYMQNDDDHDNNNNFYNGHLMIGEEMAKLMMHFF